MKTKLTLILFLSSILSFADGGDGYGTLCHVHDMDIINNLFYQSIDSKLTVVNKKGKENIYNVTSNISIYNINSGKIAYLFPDTLNESIEEFYFETYYDSLTNKILFNRDNYDEYSMRNIIGNIDIKKRLPSNKLFILTYSYVTSMYTLWTANKFGTELNKVYTFSDDTNYYFDVKNMLIRFVKQVDKKIDIKDIKY